MGQPVNMASAHGTETISGKFSSLYALAAAQNEGACKIIANVLRDCGFQTVSSAVGAENTRKHLQMRSFALAALYLPLGGEFGLDLVREIHTRLDTAIILVARSEDAEHIQQAVAYAGAFVLARPVNRSMLMQAVRFVMTSREEILRLKSENLSLQEKIDEIRVAARAKCMLMEVLKMTEIQAHRYLQKQAMDRRVSLAEVSRDVLKTYEP